MRYPFQLTQTSAPAAEPVSTADAKTHLRVTWSDDDTYIDTLVKAARTFLEKTTNRQLITATWRLSLPRFPCGPIRLPRPPLGSVSSITYVDTDGDTNTVDSSDYDVISDAEPVEVYPAFGETWPTDTRDVANCVKVTYTAGYGAAGSSVPEPLILATKILVAHWYENREPVSDVELKPVPMSVTSLLTAYKVRPLDPRWYTRRSNYD